MSSEEAVKVVMNNLTPRPRENWHTAALRLVQAYRTKVTNAAGPYLSEKLYFGKDQLADLSGWFVQLVLPLVFEFVLYCVL